jgi:hypothetical protein
MLIILFLFLSAFVGKNLSEVWLCEASMIPVGFRSLIMASWQSLCFGRETGLRCCRSDYSVGNDDNLAILRGN